MARGNNIENTDDRAVSPVIGIVLMVGIVVALGAVTGAAVLGTGSNIGETAPNAQFEMEFVENETSFNEIRVTHMAGETIDAERLNYKYDGVTANAFSSEPDGEVSAGDRQFVDTGAFTGRTYDTGETFELHWVSESGETSSVIASYEIQR